MISKLETITMVMICVSVCCLSAMPVASNCKTYAAIRSYTKVHMQQLNPPKVPGSAWKVLEPAMSLRTNSTHTTDFPLCNRRNRAVNIRWFKNGTTYGLAATGSSVVFKRVPDNDEIIFRVKCTRGNQNCRARCTFENTMTKHYLADMLDGKGTVALAKTSKLDRKAWWCLD